MEPKKTESRKQNLKRWVVLCNGKRVGFAFTKLKALRIANQYSAMSWFSSECLADDDPAIRIQIMEEEIE